ncbi:hypothetical protein PCANC_12386 [Puccinia coronata f. sp. avenae]|uniref:Nitrogen permease regulator 3 n=1 Tax=Puccinia coronata f. sp. avenae TaxID=200324 RepID=A0A2N5VK30_9BASI|nr:hypothetical protein PCANC_12386 [Puccinia coronata f. sp. avenae]PLW50351.1 hypothetical protein PCASD_01693 [Puccinia coronata f. sp. avenae]
MSSLLAVMLVTQADQSSPSMVFAWPPRPQPTPRLDRPVYKREQSQICGSDPSLYSGKKHFHGPHSADYRDHHGNRFVRSLTESDHWDGHYGESSSDETSFRPFNQPTSRRVLSSGSSGLPKPNPHEPSDFDDEDDDSIFPPGLFYESHHSDSVRLSAKKSAKQSSLPGRGSAYLGFQPDEWADMLTPRIHGSPNLSFKTPKGMVSGRKLELVIDALAIIGHPVLVNQKPTHQAHTELSMERGRTRTRSGDKGMTSSPIDSPQKSSSSQSPFLKAALPNQASNPRTSSSDPPLSTNDGVDLNALDLNDALPTSSRSKPPIPAPISQLTRMMTPSITPVDPSSSSTPARVFLHPRSSASTRSNSSPSPVNLPSRFNIRERYNPIPYSPMCGFLQKAPTVTVDERQQTDEPPSMRSTHLIPLQSFTLALIIDTPPASHLSQHLEVYYRDVVLKLTAALKHLERESSYLTREVQLMMHKLSERRGSYSNRSSSQRKQPEIGDMMEFVEQSSDLARALARTFEDLKTLGTTSITLDRQLDLDLLLHRDLLDSNTAPENWLLANSVKTPKPETGDQDRFAHLESWKSLLLLEDPQVLIEQTAPGSLLRDFIAIIKPALTLSEYKFLLDTDSNTIAEMTDHLLYWRKAKLTDMITLRNSYQLTCPIQAGPSNLSSDRLPIAQLQYEFSTTFPNLPHLVMILSLISQRSRQPFSTILPLLNPNLEKSESMAVLVWLLKRDLLLRERTHVRIKIDRETKMKLALWEQEQKQQKGSEEYNEEMDEQSSLSAGSPARNRANRSGVNQTIQVSCSLPTDSRYQPVFGSQPKENSQKGSDAPVTESVKIQNHRQERVAFERSSMSVIHPCSVPDGLHRHNRVTQSLQPGSLTSITSSDEYARDPRRRLRQESVQSDFSALSEALPRDGSDETPAGLILLSHKVDQLADSIIGEPGQATTIEQKWLDEICAEKSDAQIRAFNSAFRYFNGRYALEEIVSRSGLSRKALNEVLNEFKPHLILLIHP